jgi:glycosyltransferase involved in cell wall biosynthesis
MNTTLLKDTHFPLPKISIIIPVYNTEPYLRQCLDSAVNQTFKDIEIICINDGSNDGCLDILRQYRRMDKRIKIIDQENKGQGEARNAGLDVASGEYLCFIDSDDWLELSALSELYAKAKSCNADMVLFSGKLCLDGEIKPVSWLFQDGLLPQKKETFSHRDVPETIFQIQQPSVCLKFFNRLFWESHKIRFSKGKFEDVYPSLLLLSFAQTITHISKPFYNYRKGISTSTTANKNLFTEDLFEVFNEVKRELKNRTFFPFIENSFWKRYLDSAAWILQGFGAEQISSKKYFMERCKITFPEKYFAELKCKAKLDISCSDLASKNAPAVHHATVLPFKKKYTNFHVQWHTHLYRAGASLFVVCEKPWHTHVYRAWKALCKDSRYAPIPKRHTRLRVPWHTHLYRAGVSIFVVCEKPWHTHIYRAWSALCHDSRYAVRPKASAIIPVCATAGILDNVIISLTSYPARIRFVHLTIETLLNQTKKAAKAILWLADSDFPNREGDLPEELLSLKNRGLTISWCEDLRSYKKLIPALMQYPNALICTADDDILYSNDWLEKLHGSYLKNPNVLNCMRMHKIRFENGKIKPYKQWEMTAKNPGASFLNFSTGVAGVLYKREHLHDDVFRKDLFMRLCPHGDDIWFWAMAVLKGTKIKIVDGCNFQLTEIKEAQECALWYENVNGGRNDEQLRNVFEHYPEILEKIRREYCEEAPESNSKFSM